MTSVYQLGYAWALPWPQLIPATTTAGIRKEIEELPHTREDIFH